MFNDLNMAVINSSKTGCALMIGSADLQIQRGSRRWRVVESSKFGWSTQEVGQFPSQSTFWTLLADSLINQSSRLKKGN